MIIARAEDENKKLLHVLCTTMRGSKYIQKCFQNLLNHHYNNGCNNNNNIMNSSSTYINGNCNFDVKTIKSITSDFVDSISPFGHLLCIDMYGHYTINKLLTICYQFNAIHVLAKFMQNIIVKNFAMLMEHPYPSRIVQNMLNSNSKPLKLYSIAQLNTLFYPAQHLQNQLQPENLKMTIPTNVKNVTNSSISLKHDINTVHTTGKTHITPAQPINCTSILSPATGCDQMPLKEQLETPLTQEANNSSGGSGDFQFLHDTIKHHIGNYIIQAMIETACGLDMSHIVLYIFEFVAKHIPSLACDRCGSRVVQRCIASTNVPSVTKLCLIANILQSLPIICNHEHGNYCVRKCIQCDEKSIRELFVEQILFGIDVNVKNYSNSKEFNARYTLPRSLKESYENYVSHSQNPYSILNLSKFGFGKYSSVVCDLAFRYADMDQQSRFIGYFCNQNIPIKYNALFGLINHEYGNFVIKNAIKTLINSHQTAIRDKHNFIQNGWMDRAYDAQQREKHYSSLLNAIKQAVNNTFEFVSNYHHNNKFSFAYNVIKLINQNF